MKIAFIGTGVMGAPMARHLATKSNHQLYVYNRTKAKAKKLSDCAIVCDTIAQAVSQADVVFSIVGFVKDVEEIYLGQDGILQHAKAHTIVCDMTTSSATLAQKIYESALTKEIEALDAPVTGGDLGAINATLSIMVGGKEEIFQKILPLLKLMGKTVTYMGKSGNGQLTKLANQMSIAGAIAGIAQALAFAQEKELELTKVLDVIANGSASSWQAINNGPKMISQDYQPGFFLKHFIKDLKLGLQESELSLELSQLILQQYEKLAQQGKQDLSTAAIFDYYLNQ